MNAVAQAEARIAIEGDGVELRMQMLGGGMTAAFVRVPVSCASWARAWR